MMKYLLSFIIMGVIAIAYIKTPEKLIVHAEDFQQYLNAEYLNNKVTKFDKEIDFWKYKLAASPNNFVYQKKIAALYAAKFKLTGEIQLLHESDAILEDVHQRYPNQVGTLHQLTANAITKHEFLKAEKYANAALAIGEKKYLSSLLLTDVALERGDLWQAKALMNNLNNRNKFDYLIRNLKVHDNEGDLSSAIENMEAALEQAKKANNQYLINWSLSNLADMYGHDGQIEKSYQTYLKALTYDPTDLHSLKGIAWIAYSKDQNTVLAKEILSFLKTVHPIPDYDILLAEIAEFEGNLELANQYEQQFLAVASQSAYSQMYQSYIAQINAAKPTAIQIAKAEIKERPHPMSYDLLAWSALQNGDKSMALRTIETYVVNKTEEPDALYHAGVIFKENGNKRAAKEYLIAALDAAFELGPVTKSEIVGHLEQL